MIIIGDVHGFTKSYQRWIQRNLDPSVRTIQIGDMGLGFSGVGLPSPGMQLLDGNHKFFRGNHDNPAKCRAHKNYLGDYGYLPQDGIFWCAGAWSIDQAYRVEGVSWWRDEELSYDELGKALELYEQTKPRFVLSHEAPAKAAGTLLMDMVGPYAYEKAKCADSRTSQALQMMLDKHEPEEWIFGHFHVDKQFYVPNCSTKFRCVGGIMQDGEQPHTYELKT